MPDEEEIEKCCKGCAHGEEDFNIIRDEFVQRLARDSELAFNKEMYGNWIEEHYSVPETLKKIPVCADSIHEKHMIMNRLCAAWCHQPTLTLGQLVSMQFSSMTDIFQSGDYDFIKAVESIRSLDHPKCETQLKKDRAISVALRNALEKLSESIDAIEVVVKIFDQEEGEG